MTTAAGTTQALETVRVDVADHLSVVTVNRPEVRNAVNQQVQADLRRALAELRGDDSVGAVVFTGAGDHSFIAGADITQLKDYTLHTALESDMQRLYDEIEAFEKPTIAAVNGYALGGGCELAMACDIRIAADTARFGLPETNLSVLPGAGGTQRLARLVGTGRAIEMILTGRMVDAAEASAIGLVTSVVPAASLLNEARRVADQVLRKGPLSVRLAKLVIRTGMDAGQHTGLVVERLAQALLYTSDDKREGTEAFLAKRPPAFRGR
ncbi:enoyl-CoA hydratase [Streptomyces sp. NTH33]|uniref:enoyl-CoA hydratase/isomerase family protein n=1 Tax=Streptomyces sp. NTH33 TaxID=1735453 RepID=UPI000DAAA37B|nr:enoyl-CoA hydratase-related protein [Streptomyces sp. NTH33]PZH09055.1 enoyl-CoA hydratase [Streptomyces sp. NTH33]